ncbi:ankyrin repeat-containing domain protein, partial [Mycotypha africana]|uniref:ankyrin repeat-containing domain protein n=1 Tax=Mycotypha africana TaxID=64632 RepID=UPI002301F612
MPLQLACINENHIAVVQYLIDRGADVNAQKWSKKHSVDKSQAVAGATGSTALHVACANGCTKIVDLLLRNGAKTNVRDKYSSRPVDVAAAKNHTEIVRLLETFESMEMMLQGLQEGKDHQQHNRQQITKSSKRDRLRRPSLPCVIEAQQQGLDIPDISTLPPPRRSFNVSVRPSPEEL